MTRATKVLEVSTCWGLPSTGRIPEGALGGETQDGQRPPEAGAFKNQRLLQGKPVPAHPRTAASPLSEAKRPPRVLRNYRELVLDREVQDRGDQAVV